ncbi:MAG: HNH endonuclease [Acidobacteriota bacterium]
MEGWIAVTHSHWFDHLAQRPQWDEVNFWSPSDYYAFHGTPGAPFFFKLKSPRNAIGGFGYVSAFARLPEWLAWECFGEGNGAATFADLKGRLDRLRTQDHLRGRGGLTQIGCILLTDAVFFPRDMWIAQPTDWARQNLRYTRYDLTRGEGLRVWEECQQRTSDLRTPATGYPVSSIFDRGERYGPPTLYRPRLGQGTFRVAVTEAYGRACAVTGEHSLPVLEAAHIRPYAEEGPHDVRNGLLLRSDLHRLFDKGYVTVTPTLHLEVSRRLREEYENGHSYYPLTGPIAHPPQSEVARPSAEFLRWHNEHVYLG